MAGKKGNPSPALPFSRGIPADESLWLPRHYGKEVREKGGIDKTVIWNISDLVDFIFPRKYQPRYHEVACAFIDLLLANDLLTKKEISKFLKEKGYSKSTLENKIIPKLVRLGLELFPAPSAVASPTVTAVKLPAGRSWPAFDAALRRRGLVVAGSYGPLAGKVFRLGHMGSQADMALVEKAVEVIAGVV